MAETKLSTAQLGGNEKVWNESNLVSGKNVKIEKHINPNVITEDTYGLFHWDNSSADLMDTMEWGYGEAQYTTYSKFGTHCLLGNGSTYGVVNFVKNNGTTDTFRYDKNFTLDTWIAFSGSAATTTNYETSTGFMTQGSGYGCDWTRGNYLRVRFLASSIVFDTTVGKSESHTISYPSGWSWNSSTWHHVAIMYKDGTSYLYLDGKLQTDCTITGLDEQTWSFRSVMVMPQMANQDETRISKAAVYPTDSDFDLPTEAYQEAGSTPDYWELNTSGLAKTADLAAKQDTIVAGTNITIAADGKTLSATDTTYSAFTGADGSNAGTAGLVPAPAAVDNTKFLRGDGTWAEAGGSSITVDQTYNASSTNAQSGTAVAQAVAGVHVPNFTRTWYKNNTGNTIQIVNTSSALSVAIYRNGALLEPTDDYTISGTTLTLVDALTASEKITVEVYQ